MKKIILGIFSIAIVFSILWITIKKTIGTEIKIVEVNIANAGKIKLFPEKKPFYSEREVFLIIWKEDSHLKMNVDYLIKNFKKHESLVEFLPDENFLNFLGLSWGAKAEEILKKLDGLKIILKEIPY
jgi:hypothetical protein